MSQYYFIGTVLPDLTLDSEPEINFFGLDTLLRDNLSEEDYAKTTVIRGYFDILNLRSLWMGQEIDPRGELNASELEEALINHVSLPGYIFEFLARYHTVGERIHHFPALLANFFRHAKQEKDPFLSKYFTFEREFRLILTAYRAKKLGRDLSVELQYEDPEEELISHFLVQKDAKALELPEKYEDLRAILEKNENDPMALERALDEYRFNTIDKLVDMSDMFSIDRILAYMAQLTVVEKWFGLDKKAGLKIVDTIVKGK